MVTRRTAIALVTLLALGVLCMPAVAQDFNFGSAFRVRGMTTHTLPGGQGGSLSGVLNLNGSGGLTSGALTRNPGATTSYTGGGLTEANRNVFGVFSTATPGEEILATGVVLNPDVLVFTTTSGIVLPPLAHPPVNPELGVAFAVRQTGTYSGADLQSSNWRFKAMATPVLPPVSIGEGGWAFGSITLSNTRSVTGGSVTFPNGNSDSISAGGTFNINASGTVTGTFSSGLLGTNHVSVNGIMSPDKTMIVAIMRLSDDTYPNRANGLVILEREPAVTFSTPDLAGTWDLVGLDQNEEPNGNVGRWVIGNTTVTATGLISAGTLVSGDFAGEPSGLLAISSDGFICSGGPLCDNFISVTDPDSSILSIHAIMSADKSTVFGVYNRFTSSDEERRGLFTLVRRPDSPPASIVQFSATEYTRAESAGATSIDVVRTGSLATSATVRYTITGGSATRGSDYTAPLTRVLTFGPGVGTVAIPVTILNDTIEEASETIYFDLRNPTGGMTIGANSMAELIITDDDPAGALAFSSSVYTATEGGPAAVITVVRTGGTASGVTVQYATSNGTALAGLDYLARTGTLTFGAGQTSRTFTVPILDDAQAEPVETVLLTLSNPGGGGFLVAPKTALLRILDNEPTVGFTGRWVGNGLEVERTGPANVTSRLDYASVDGTAIGGVDYVALSGTLTFAPGVRIRIIPITVLRDNIAEGNETFTMQLSNPFHARLGQTVRLVVIKDNDFGGTVQFASAAYSVAEGSNRTVTVTRTGGAGTALTVHYFTSDGTGIAGTHYVPASGNLFFAVGQTSRTFTVRTLRDGAPGNRTVLLHLTVPAGAATLGPRANAVLTIFGLLGDAASPATH